MLEKQAGDKFPDNIDRILIAAGFDSKTSIKSFSNNATFAEIEKFVNENRVYFEPILKGTKYESLIPFKFLPGHAALLCGLPEYIVDSNRKNRKKIPAEKQVNEVSRSQQVGIINQPNESQSTNGIDIENNIDDSLDTAKIRKNLISKIIKFATKKNIVVNISEKNISKFQCVNGVFKCSVECPFCQKKVPCNYVTNWICGNFTAHLKTHSDLTHEEFEVNNDNQLEKVIDKTNNIVRLAKDNNKDINNILDDHSD